MCCSEFCLDVTYVDKATKKPAMFSYGEVPIYEPRRDVAVARNVTALQLQLAMFLKAAVDCASTVIMEVKAPTRPGAVPSAGIYDYGGKRR